MGSLVGFPFFFQLDGSHDRPHKHAHRLWHLLSAKYTPIQGQNATTTTTTTVLTTHEQTHARTRNKRKERSANAAYT